MTPCDAVRCARIAYLQDGRDEAAKLGFSYQSLHREGTFCWIGRKGRKTIVAVRGSGRMLHTALQHEPNRLTDQVPWLGNGRVHQGYYQSLWQILNELRILLRGQTEIYFTGHSYGAAIAMLSAILIGGQRVFCFASPKVGDLEFAEAAQGTLRITRYENRCDTMTRYPHWGSIKGTGGQKNGHYVHAGRRVRLAGIGSSISSYVRGLQNQP
ncbi:MAG: lipase family protein [Sneathiella sp.]